MQVCKVSHVVCKRTKLESKSQPDAVGSSLANSCKRTKLESKSQHIRGITLKAMVAKELNLKANHNIQVGASLILQLQKN